MSGEGKVTVEVIPGKEKAPCERSTQMDFLIRLTAPERPAVGRRPRLNLGLVLDRSGSMSGKKLHKAKEAVCYCVDQLLSEDRISVTVFDDQVDVIVPTTPANNRSQVKRAVQGVRSGGCTALHGAWLAGARQVAECADTGWLNRVVLVTDGLANVGLTEPEEIIAQAAGLFERGISTSTIGIGNDFNEDLLVPMAEKAGGNSWFVEGPEDFERIFATEMEGLLREVCSKVRLRIEPAQGVELLDLLNDFQRDEDGAYRLPGLLAGEPLDVLVRLKLPGGFPEAFHCFQLTLSWEEREAGVRFSRVERVSLVRAPRVEVDALSEHPEVLKARQLLDGARARKEAMEHLDRGDYHMACQCLESAAASFRKAPAALFQDAIFREQADEFEALCAVLEDEQELGLARKRMAYQSHNLQRGRRPRKH